MKRPRRGHPGRCRCPPGSSRTRPRRASPSLPADAQQQALRWLLPRPSRHLDRCARPGSAGAAAPGRRQLGGGGLGARALLVRVRARQHRRGAHLNAGCWFEGHGRIVIGRDSFVRPQVMIFTSVTRSGQAGSGTWPGYRDVRIGDRCWLGTRAMVMPGVTYRRGHRIVAAGAVVTKDCEPGAGVRRRTRAAAAVSSARADALRQPLDPHRADRLGRDRRERRGRGARARRCPGTGRRWQGRCCSPACRQARP